MENYEEKYMKYKLRYLNSINNIKADGSLNSDNNKLYGIISGSGTAADTSPNESLKEIYKKPFNLENYDTYLFDMDGVIKGIGESNFIGAAKFINRLLTPPAEKKKKKIKFI